MRTKITLAGVELGVFDDEEIDMNLAMQLEDKTGLTIVELGQQVGRGSARAIQAMVWLTQLQAGKPADLHQNFKFKDLQVENVEEPAEEPVGKGVKAVKAA